MYSDGLRLPENGSARWCGVVVLLLGVAIVLTPAVAAFAVTEEAFVGGCAVKGPYAGGGNVNWANQKRLAGGHWVDDCGGDKCDDRVTEGYFLISGVKHSFSIQEGRIEGNCKVNCEVDGFHQTMDGYVNPWHKKGTSVDNVEFECVGWFMGALNTNNPEPALEAIGELFAPSEA